MLYGTVQHWLTEVVFNEFARNSADDYEYLLIILAYIQLYLDSQLFCVVY